MDRLEKLARPVVWSNSTVALVVVREPGALWKPRLCSET